MNEAESIFAVEFEHLFSGIGDWTVQLINAADEQMLGEQTCVPLELSKLLMWNGEKMITGVLVNDNCFAITQVHTQPALSRTSIHVLPYSANTQPHVLRTPAQCILRSGLLNQLRTPVNYVHMFLKLNDHLFNKDPASLIFVADESQYDEYDYLAENILAGLMNGEHPEHTFRTVFMNAGLNDRVSFEAVQNSLDAIFKLLDVLAENPAYDPALLQENAEVFVYATLLQPELKRVDPFFVEPPDDFHNASVLLSQAVLNGVNTELASIQAFLSIAPECNLDHVPHEERNYAINCVERTISSARILLKTSACKRVIKIKSKE